MNEPILTMVDVTRVHGTGEVVVRALNGVSLEIHPGELVAVMGPSGSGKSTLLNLAGALDLPTSGTVSIDGQVTTALRPNELSALRRRRVGVVFQDLNLIPSLTAAENIGLPLELDGRRVSESRRAALGALRDLNLDELADRFPDQTNPRRMDRALWRATDIRGPDDPDRRGDLRPDLGLQLPDLSAGRAGRRLGRRLLHHRRCLRHQMGSASTAG